MTFSIYEELLSMREADDYMLKNKVELMGLGHIFSEYVWHKYQEAGHFKALVFYACYTYSWESKLIRLGSDWQKNKTANARRAGIPDYMIDDVVNLKDELLKECFHEFLNLYRENMDYVHLTQMKDFYQQLMAQANSFKVDENGNSDVAGKIKFFKSASEILIEIKKSDKELLDNYRILDRAKSDFERIDPTEQQAGVNPVRYENSPLIR